MGTGGIFNAETKTSIKSPKSGIIKFSNNLKFLNFRTSCGQDVLLTKNSGFLKIFNINTIAKPYIVRVLPDTILFYNNGSLVKKNTILGQFKNLNKQIRTELRPIESNVSGEIFFPADNKIKI